MLPRPALHSTRRRRWRRLTRAVASGCCLAVAAATLTGTVPTAAAAAAIDPLDDHLGEGWGAAAGDDALQYVVMAHPSLALFEQHARARDGRAPDLASLERVPVTYVNGQRSVCFLPSTATGPGPDPAAGTAAAAADYPVTPQEKLEAVGARIASFHGSCVTASAGYWQYTVCPFSHVRQFHANGKGKPDTEFSLGSFRGSNGNFEDDDGDDERDDGDEVDAAETAGAAGVAAVAGESMEVPAHVAKAGSAYTAYTQTFTGGTDDRRTRVHFVCAGSQLDPSRAASLPGKGSDRSAAVAAATWRRRGGSSTPGAIAIVDIQEDPQHVYHLTVATPDVCGVSESPRELIAAAAEQAVPAPAAAGGGSSRQQQQQQCLRHVGAWWTAEVCPFRSVRQYHKELDGSRTEISLGSPRADSGTLVATDAQAAAAAAALRQQLLASSPTTGPEAERRATAMAEAVGGDTLPYFEEVFTGGAKCGARPDAPRRATVVRYFCDAAGADGDSGDAATSAAAAAGVSSFRSIAAFEEAAECLYKAELRLPELCRHPAFHHLVTTPSDAPTVAHINCVPAADLD